MLKKILMSYLLLFLLTTPALGYEDIIDIKINGEYIYTDTSAVIEHGVTLAPMRFVADALGAKSITWDEKNYVAEFDIKNDNIQIDITNKHIYLNNKLHEKNSKAKIINDRTYVPVRLISELLGADVSWDSHYKNVEISLASHEVSKESISKLYGDDELLWLSRIIHAESRGEPIDGKIAVGNVILNRVKSHEFPNTIYNVIFDRKPSVQFEPIINGSIYNSPGKDSIKAAKHALSGTDVAGKSLYFFNPKIATSSWISKNRPYFKTIHNHDFYL